MTDEEKIRSDWDIRVYTEGSEACRNYSRLTMKTRTLSQQVLILGVVGVGAAMSKEGSVIPPEILLIVGIAFLLFSISLAFVDWHYQSAFTAIRNSLAVMEAKSHMEGPWRAHLGARTQLKDHVASYFPFLLLALASLCAIGYGVSHCGQINESANKIICYSEIAFGILLILSFVVACKRAKKLDAKFKADIDEIGKNPQKT